GFVKRAFASQQGRTVVAHENDQRVFQEPPVLEFVEDEPYLLIQLLDFAVIGREVLPHVFGIRIAGREDQAARFGQKFSGRRVWAVGIAVVDPQKEGLAGWYLVQESLHRREVFIIGTGMEEINPAMECP